MNLTCWLLGPRYKTDIHFFHRCIYCGKTRRYHGKHRWWWP